MFFCYGINTLNYITILSCGLGFCFCFFDLIEELISGDKLDWFKLADHGIDIKEYLTPEMNVDKKFYDFISKCLIKDPKSRPTAAQLLDDPFINFDVNNQEFVKFSDVQLDQQAKNRTLDKVLFWLQEWILEDDEANASFFEDGDPAFLKQCVNNLSRVTGHSTEYIDRYIAEVYRELVSNKN